jgi:hypothetical protein
MDYSRIVREATARKRELLDEINKLDALISSAAALAQPGAAASAGSSARAAASTGGSVISPTRDAVRSILRERGEPLQTRELVPLVRAKGIEVGGKDAVATLSARLSNSSEFKVHRGIGWWFNDEPLPYRQVSFEEAAGYPPKDDPAASNANQGGSEDAAALVLETNHQ